jgi:hypothetical protein
MGATVSARSGGHWTSNRPRRSSTRGKGMTYTVHCLLSFCHALSRRCVTFSARLDGSCYVACSN